MFPSESIGQEDDQWQFTKHSKDLYMGTYANLNKLLEIMSPNYILRQH